MGIRNGGNDTDRLPSGASAGERKVFALLQQLPDEVIVYYEPVVANRYPDFIVIIPSVGLLIIEVKGWYPAHILKANNVDFTVSSRGQPETASTLFGKRATINTNSWIQRVDTPSRLHCSKARARMSADSSFLLVTLWF